MTTTIGSRITRLEDEPLLRGRGRFVDDIAMPGVWHTAFVRSPHPHALIKDIDKAAALYRECRLAGHACKIEVSGGDARGLGQPEAAIYAGDLQRLGVDAADLLLEPRSMNTWQNAQFSGPLLQASGADRVLLVSSGFHLRRGMLYFSHFGIRATPVRADYVDGVLSWLPLSYNFTMADLSLHEYAGIARYRLYNAMGWNVQATRAGAL